MGLFDLIDSVVDKVGDALGASAPEALPDVGEQPPAAAGPATQFPNASASSVMDQVNQSMAVATENYQEGMKELEDAPRFDPGKQATDIVDNVMNASPEQLEAMEAQAGGLAASEEIRASVSESHGELLGSKSDHFHEIAENSALIHGQSVSQAAEAAADRAEDASS